jgi:hypothetical protein
MTYLLVLGFERKFTMGESSVNFIAGEKEKGIRGDAFPSRKKLS